MTYTQARNMAVSEAQINQQNIDIWEHVKTQRFVTRWVDKEQPGRNQWRKVATVTPAGEIRVTSPELTDRLEKTWASEQNRPEPDADIKPRDWRKPRET